MRIQGVITVIGDVQTGTSKAGKEFKKREGVLVYDSSNPTYPKGFAFTIMGKNVDNISLTHGEQVDVEVDFGVSEYNGRHFTSATIWRKYDLSQQMPPQPQQQYPQQQQAYPQQNPYGMMGPQTTYTPPTPYGYPQQAPQQQPRPYQPQQQQPFGAGQFPPAPQPSDADPLPF
ncbi:MAG: DUF3127 domain-containing protein [Muribaculaceae bacterium]|nr:DUF3127 domain-containing protein [Muribaculaceae bacterium]